MLVWFVIALVFRWRFQFSIRSLLVLVVAVALPFSWLGVEMKQAREQKAVVAAIEKLGGTVGYYWTYDIGNDGPLPDPNERPPGPAWLGSLLGDDFFGE